MDRHIFVQALCGYCTYLNGLTCSYSGRCWKQDIINPVHDGRRIPEIALARLASKQPLLEVWRLLEKEEPRKLIYANRRGYYHSKGIVSKEK